MKRCFVQLTNINDIVNNKKEKKVKFKLILMKLLIF